MENDSDLGRVMQEHVRMLRDFPEARQNPRNASTAVTLLGDLAILGTAGTADTWRSDLELLAQSFDVKASFRRAPTFTGTVADSTDHIRFEPFEGIDPRRHDDTTLPFAAVQARTLTYDQVFHEVALIFADLEEEGDPDPFAQRELTSGERVFHRKVGNGRKFDRFDKGSPSPCVHGTFIVWTKAPKALKGFHRRYSNFQDSWLRHCSRKMNCGMYAAFAPDIRTERHPVLAARIDPTDERRGHRTANRSRHDATNSANSVSLDTSCHASATCEAT
ncbi:MAG: hypothetical protein WAK00_11925 [Microbacterium sp.]|uniref:hypothetical protein n=1 Tax=Microbacterium sp. TaxID=51671 RepID=UPI003BAE8E42